MSLDESRSARLGARHELRVSFHEQLEALRGDVQRLFALVGEAIGRGTQAFLAGDLVAAEQLVAADSAIDALYHACEEDALQLLARQAPVARDLRLVVAILRSVHELERAGDLMVNVAKGARRLYPASLEPRIRGLVARLGDQAAAQMRTAADAFGDMDPARAAAVGDMDDVMDDLMRDLLRTIFATGATDEAGLQRAVQVALVGRYYERMGDHAVNIAERVVFAVTGSRPHLDEPARGESLD
jgi:phosphate transport system protein